MKREILFRGKRVDNGEWVYGDLCAQDSEHNAMIGVWRKVARPYCEWIPVNEHTVGQLTGLKDKNNNDIYEGDIMTFERFVGTKNDSIKWVVEYSADKGFKSWHSVPDDAIIVGNIYEHKHLLETSLA